MKKAILWILQILSAVILLQTLFFKFTAAPESVELFTQLGMEPGGRILIGVIELIAAILLLIPASAAYGALLGAGVMTGAIIGHFTHLGVSGPMLSLFLLAVAVFVMCVSIMFLRRKELPIINKMLEKPGSE